MDDEEKHERLRLLRDRYRNLEIARDGVNRINQFNEISRKMDAISDEVAGLLEDMGEL
jgi:hypothetical protein